MERLARSIELARACWALLMNDRRLLVFPLLSAVSVLLVVATFALPLLPNWRTFAGHGAGSALRSVSWSLMFLFYWIQYTIIVFFNTALVEVAFRRFDGEDAGVRDGLARAVSRLPVIVLYAGIAATVGTLLRMVESRLGFIGRLVTGLVGLAWTIATALVVPVLAAENVGPTEAVARSVALVKRTWGESLIGNVGIGLVFGAITIVTVLVAVPLVAIGFATGHAILAALVIVAVVVAICLLGLAQASLHGIYAAALYRYAIGDRSGTGIAPHLLRNAFQPK